jgi:hypothetical protein
VRAIDRYAVRSIHAPQVYPIIRHRPVRASMDQPTCLRWTAHPSNDLLFDDFSRTSENAT